MLSLWNTPCPDSPEMASSEQPRPQVHRPAAGPKGEREASVLFLEMQALASYYTVNKTLMMDPLPVLGGHYPRPVHPERAASLPGANGCVHSGCCHRRLACCAANRVVDSSTSHQRSFPAGEEKTMMIDFCGWTEAHQVGRDKL